MIPNLDDISFDGLSLSAPAQVNRSTWTGRRKVIGRAGAETWRGKATIGILTTESQEQPWRAWLFGLDGPVGVFNWPLPCQRHIGEKPLVGASPSNGYTLPLSGLTPNALILKAGQYMTVPLPSGHSRAVVLTADLLSTGAGLATATFRPALNETPTVGATVETADPFIPMALTADVQGFSLDNGVSGTSFDCEEAL